MGSRQAGRHTGVKEIVTLLVKSKMHGHAVFHSTSRVRATEAMPPVERTPMASEIDGCDLTNRVTTPLTSAGNFIDSPAPLRRPLPSTGHDADILD
jgi:hypothetical protein